MKKYNFYLLIVCFVTCVGILWSCGEGDKGEVNDERPAESKAETVLQRETSKETAVESVDETKGDNDSETVKETEAETEKETVAETIAQTEAELEIAGHKPLGVEEYYHYSFLSKKEQAAYRQIQRSVEKYVNNINLSSYNFDTDTLSDLFYFVITDNPQYFWLSANFAVTRAGGLEVYYTDGLVSDMSIDGKKADRSLINKQRKEFDWEVERILSFVDPELSDYEKELAIHDYLTQNVSYNNYAAEHPNKDNMTHPAYNAYYTLVEKSAVCEGYTEAFQWLCYKVGINSNQVIGQQHIWNTVKIDGEWYQVDVTWDDPIDEYGNSGDGNHNYFNLTSAEMYAVHPRSDFEFDNWLRVPECTATKYRYNG